MAMTKAEQARMARFERDVALAKAMAWPTYSAPAPMTKADIESNLVDGGVRYAGHFPQQVARGWFANSFQHGNVSFGCSNGTNSNSSGDTTCSQGMGRMFVSELDAWRTIRLELTERYAENLARIDVEIKRCEESR